MYGEVTPENGWGSRQRGTDFFTVLFNASTAPFSQVNGDVGDSWHVKGGVSPIFLLLTTTFPISKI